MTTMCLSGDRWIETDCGHRRPHLSQSMRPPGVCMARWNACGLFSSYTLVSVSISVRCTQPLLYCAPWCWRECMTAESLGTSEVTFHTPTQGRQPHLPERPCAERGCDHLHSREVNEARDELFHVGKSFLSDTKTACTFRSGHPSARNRHTSAPGKTADALRFISLWSSMLAVLLSIRTGACVALSCAALHGVRSSCPQAQAHTSAYLAHTNHSTDPSNPSLPVMLSYASSMLSKWCP
jgi:hypothetical protein